MPIHRPFLKKVYPTVALRKFSLRTDPSRRSLSSSCWLQATVLSFTLFASGARADQGLLPYTTTVPRTSEGDSLRLNVFELWRYDSNLFRLPDGVEPNGTDRRSAYTMTTGFGLSFDKTYGLQRLVIDASLINDHYIPYHNLDFTGSTLTSTYYWRITPAVSGDLIFDHSRLPTDYEYVGLVPKANPRTTQRMQADVDWRAGAALHPRLSVFQREDKTEDTTFQLESSRSTVAEISAIYNFRSGNSAEAYGNRSRGENLGRTDNAVTLQNKRFTQSEYGLRGTWNGTEGGTLFWRLAHVDRVAQTFSQRDFSGVVGNVDGLLKLSGKTSLLLSAAKSLSGTEASFASFYDDYSVATTLQYALTNKVSIKPAYTFRRQVYRSSPFPIESNLVETTRYPSLEVDWLALRSLDFAFQVSYSTRGSNVPALEFSNRSASLFARFKF